MAKETENWSAFSPDRNPVPSGSPEFDATAAARSRRKRTKQESGVFILLMYQVSESCLGTMLARLLSRIHSKALFFLCRKTEPIRTQLTCVSLEGRLFVLGRVRSRNAKHPEKRGCFLKRSRMISGLSDRQRRRL